MHRYFFFAALAAAAVLAACGANPTPAPGPRIEPTIIVPPPPALDPTLIAEGQRVYAQHCAACHGAALEGKPNWKTPLASGRFPAPPHDDSGHTWHHDDALLTQIVVEGGNGSGGVIPSDMPAFGDKLAPGEVDAVLAYIKSRWSPQMREYQWRVTVEGQGHR